VQLEDGTIYTAYYATTSIKKVDGYDLLIHAGGVAYTEEIFAV